MKRIFVFVLFLAVSPVVAFAQQGGVGGGVRVARVVSDIRPVSGEELRSASASNVKSLTLADVERLALENNPVITEATSHIEAAEGQRIQAGLYPNPQVGYHATEIGNLGTSGSQGGFVSQRVITGGKRRLDLAIANQELDEAFQFYEAQKTRVLNDGRIRFYDALVARRRVELTLELVSIADELVGYSQKLIDARQVSENDLLQAEIEAESSKILLDNASNEDLESWRRLAAAIGISEMEAAPLEGNLEEGTPNYRWDEVVSQLSEQSPELNAAWIRVERARYVLERAGREKIPNIDLFASVRHNNITNDEVANVQLGIPLPIFDANQGNIYRAEADLMAAEAEVRRVELDLQDRLAIVFRRHGNARQQADRYQQRILPRANKSLSLVTKAYSLGQTDYLGLITSQRTYIRSHLAYLDALQALRESTVLIEGQLLSGGLKAQR